MNMSARLVPSEKNGNLHLRIEREISGLSGFCCKIKDGPEDDNPDSCNLAGGY